MGFQSGEGGCLPPGIGLACFTIWVKVPTESCRGGAGRRGAGPNSKPLNKVLSASRLDPSWVLLMPCLPSQPGYSVI